MNALYRSVLVATVLSALGFIPITMGFDTTGKFSFWHLYVAALVGLVVTFLLVAITEYYTGTRWNPVKAISKASETGHATNIIEGLAIGMQATALPVIVIAAGILVANHVAGLYGIGVAVMAQLSMTGLIVALDAYGPVTDNAGGIAEMADLPPEVRAITDPLDAVGNTTKAVTKGYAIGSAALAALVLFGSYADGLHTQGAGHGSLGTLTFDLSNAWVIAGLFIGGLMPFLFASLAMQAVGRVGGEVVQEVRRQFRENPGIMEGTSRPEYGRAIDIVTKSAIRSMLVPALVPIAIPDHRRDHQSAHARRPADRDDRHRPLPRDRDDLRRRRLGQRQEADRGRRVRRQGLGGARRVGHRRHGRRSLQGHRRPRDQPDDQDRQHRRDPDHPADHLDSRLKRCQAPLWGAGRAEYRSTREGSVDLVGVISAAARSPSSRRRSPCSSPTCPCSASASSTSFAVLPVAVLWGVPLATAVSVASMLAFNWFFLPPTHTFQLQDSANWLALAVYLVTAVVVSVLATRVAAAGSRAREPSGRSRPRRSAEATRSRPRARTRSRTTSARR